MIPAPAQNSDGLKVVTTTPVPAAAVLNGGMALRVSDGALYVVFL